MVGRIDDLPVVSFTASTALPPNPPTAAYLATMARGIAETHGWGVDEIACYLQARPGIGEQWDQQSLEALLR